MPQRHRPKNSRELIISNIQAAASMLRIAHGISKLDTTGISHGVPISGSESQALSILIQDVEKFASEIDPDNRFLVRYGQG